MNKYPDATINKLVNLYADRFDENFPTEIVRYEDKITILIQKALECGKPYVVQLEDGVDY